MAQFVPGTWPSAVDGIYSLARQAADEGSSLTATVRRSGLPGGCRLVQERLHNDLPPYRQGSTLPGMANQRSPCSDAPNKRGRTGFTSVRRRLTGGTRQGDSNPDLPLKHGQVRRYGMRAHDSYQTVQPDVSDCGLVTCGLLAGWVYPFDREFQTPARVEIHPSVA
jgi:hypothetical protein